MSVVNEVTSMELEQLLQKENDIIIIDVRESEEVAFGMIEGAKHIPLKDIPLSMNTFDKDKHYVFVCRSGARSLDATIYFNRFGYESSNLIGGMLEWEGEVVF